MAVERKLLPLDDYNTKRKDFYAGDLGPVSNGISCPKCKKELVDIVCNRIPMIFPPIVNVQCEHCGFRGSRVA